MKARIIIGANLGDEGKGTVVATYTKHAEGKVLNVLTNGGAQRAHSILTTDGYITNQHFGSGTYYGADNYYSRFYILNPMQFGQELGSKLKNINILYRDISCMWSTPYDMMANAIIEFLRGDDNKHGSCGMGIWETIQRYNNLPSIPFDSFYMLSYSKQTEYLNNIKKYYEKRIGIIPDEWKHVWNGDNIIDHFIRDCILFHKMTYPIISFSNLFMNNIYSEVIFENGQGLMLCDTGLDISGTTPSNTGIQYSIELIKDSKQNFETVSVHYVTRPYLTRHGNGFVNKESKRHLISSNIDEDKFNHYNDFQGEFRYGELNISELKERISKDFSKSYIIDPNNFTFLDAELYLEVTHCDEMDRILEFKKYFTNVNPYYNPLII